MNPTPAPDKPGRLVGDKTGSKVAKDTGKAAPGLVAFVGAGPGDEELLTLRAAALIGQADLVVAAQWVGERLAHLLKEGAVLADSAGLQDDPKMLVKAARSGQAVARVFGGDPLMFCNAAAEAAAVAKAKLPFEIVPGV
jgi:uroporphyrinogen III methyltransferase / synthase